VSIFRRNCTTGIGRRPIRITLPAKPLLAALAAFLLFIALSYQEQVARADQCTPTGNVGSCTGCQQCTVVDEYGNVCDTSVVCTGPGWPNCLTQPPNSPVCSPGATYQTSTCSATGVQTCTYTCISDGTGWGNPACENVGNGGNFQQTFCDFGAGCPDGSNGQISGKPTTITQQCTQNGIVQTVTTGACGEGGCVRQAVCRPGKPCPQCKPDQTGGACDYCTPGDTRACGTQTQTCDAGGEFPPCTQCTPGAGETRTCPNGEVVTCDASGEFPPCGQCKQGDTVTCPNGHVSQCIDGHYEVCCLPGQACCTPGTPIYCSGGGVLSCTSGGVAPTCPSGCEVNGTCPQVCNRLPECHSAGAYWVCTWNGVEVVSIPKPCPVVQRAPWPRGLVGVPNRLAIVGGCDFPPSSNSVSIDPPTCDARTIIGYRGTLAWTCESGGFDGAEWTMDERPWNIGHTSDNIVSPVTGHPVGSDMLNGDLTIYNVRRGPVVTHIYETSSFDKPQDGPGWPDLAQRQPAYQVQLKTQWTLVGNFQYQQRETIEVCKDNSNPPATVPCPPSQEWCDQHPGDPNCRGDIHIHVTEIISPWHPGPVIRIPNIEIQGALTPQDTAKAPTCDTIGIPLIQSESVIVDPNR
jgi:hypothetical protein